MSDREAFDGEIERLFARPPVLDNEEAFVGRVERRLNRNWRIRAVVLSTAGVIGGFMAVRETLDVGLGAGLAQVAATSSSATHAAQSMDWGQVARWLEVGGFDLVGAPAMTLFWLVSAGVIGAALFAGLRANQA